MVGPGKGCWRGDDKVRVSRSKKEEKAWDAPEYQEKAIRGTVDYTGKPSRQDVVISCW